MSYNGSGTFVINTAGQPVVSGTVISSTAFNALTADLATGLSTAITKDGQTTPTANIPMGNNKITGLAVGTAATDAANLSQVQSTAAKLVGSVSGVDTITGTMSPTLAAYAAGQMFYFVAAGDNTGAVTLNLDGLGAKSVTRDGSVALAAGDIKSGEVVVVVYDGTRFQVVSQLNSSGDARFANVSITSALNVGGVATFTGNPVLSGGTANGVLYLNGSKVATSGSALVFDGTNLGLGVTPSAWATYKAFQLGTQGSIASTGNVMAMKSNNYFDGANDRYIASSTASDYYQNAGQHIWRTAPSGTAGNTISFTQAMTLDSSGNLGIGTSSPGYKLDTNNTSAGTIARFVNGSGRGYVRMDGYDDMTLQFYRRGSSVGFIQTDSSGTELYAGTTGAYPLVFYTNNTERARITSGGDFLVGKTADNDNVGVTLRGNGSGYFVRSGAPVLAVNRLSSDGTLVEFYQDTALEGNISVSGNTVSYNAFAGSHWSQLQDGSKPDILRGTVMESINELCVWPGENNERLPKSKISDTAGSKKVYGVFMAWDNDWTETNDMYVTAVGAFICRVNGSVTVQEGDLLESNGDGTARVQADDIIRSSTIGKVTSTVKTHEYDDGSYCVPTVLYCG